VNRRATSRAFIEQLVADQRRRLETDLLLGAADFEHDKPSTASA
jgi:hypothetical protein